MKNTLKTYVGSDGVKLTRMTDPDHPYRYYLCDKAGNPYYGTTKTGYHRIKNARKFGDGGPKGGGGGGGKSNKVLVSRIRKVITALEQLAAAI